LGLGLPARKSWPTADYWRFCGPSRGCGLSPYGRGPEVLSGERFTRGDAWKMVQRRAKAAGMNTEVCNHTFRGTGITTYLENGGTLEKARQMFLALSRWKSIVRLVKPRIPAISAEVFPRATQVSVSTSRSFSFTSFGQISMRPNAGHLASQNVLAFVVSPIGHDSGPVRANELSVSRSSRGRDRSCQTIGRESYCYHGRPSAFLAAACQSGFVYP
jgi:hypothetical protein